MKKKITAIILSLILIIFASSAMAATIKVNGLAEAKLYELYSQVQSQILLSNLADSGSYTQVTNYDDIERNPASYTGDKMFFKGKIIQVVEGTGNTTYRIAMNGKNDQVFLITYSIPEGSGRFLENDQVCVYAEFVELYTYKSTTNLSVSVPMCNAALIINPITNTNVANASKEELTQALQDIKAQMPKVVKSENGYNKISKTNYDAYARYEELHNEEKIFFSGKVLQSVEGGYENTVRLAVDSDSERVIYLKIKPDKSTIRILDDDMISVKGTYSGLYTYSSAMGGEITIPSCDVDSVEVKGYKIPTNFPKDNDGNYKLTKAQFEDFSRRPSEHEGEKITFSAKVLQVIEGTPDTAYRMAIDNDSKYTIYVEIANEDRVMRILEDDKVTVLAEFDGLMTYQSTFGAAITIPQCRATNIVVPGKAASIAQKDANGKYKVTKTNYESFARDEETYMSKPVTFTAKVIQVVDQDYTTIYRLAVDKSSDAMFLGTIDNSNLKVRILEDDIVNIVGTSTGLYSYNSTRGGKITIPSCDITDYTITGYKAKDLGSPDKDGYLKVTSKTFEELARNPDPYKGKNLTFKAKVIQVVERSGGENIYRVTVDSNNDCVFYVEYTLPTGASRILEKDVVTLKGEFYGIYTYKTTLGSYISVPALLATEMKK